MAHPALGALAALALIATPTFAASLSQAFERDAAALIQSHVDQDRFSGVVLVAKDGDIVFRQAFGHANRELSVPATAATRFRIGSITKQFTAAAILKLAEEKRLSLDDPISKYDPAAPTAWNGVTIRRLLDHTSGIPSYTALPDFFPHRSKIDLTPSQIVDLTRDKPLAFKPGEAWAYNNTGYILLGLVIEKVTGEPYATYLQQAFFDPLGMKDTGYDLSEKIITNRAAGYGRRGSQPVNAPYLAMTLPHAAGSLYSTADDLLVWDRALMGGRVIGGASLKAMFTDNGHKYGYGQFIERFHGRPFWSHAGGINGFFTMLARYPNDGLTLIVLSNLQDANVGRLTWRLADVYFDPTRADGPRGSPSSTELDRYVGRYATPDGDVVTASREGTQIFVRHGDGPPLQAFRELGRSFFVADPPNGYDFGPGERAIELRYWRQGQPVIAKRAD